MHAEELVRRLGTVRGLDAEWEVSGYGRSSGRSDVRLVLMRREKDWVIGHVERGQFSYYSGLAGDERVPDADRFESEDAACERFWALLTDG